jgi:hypothetical protein
MKKPAREQASPYKPYHHENILIHFKIQKALWIFVKEILKADNKRFFLHRYNIALRVNGI